MGDACVALSGSMATCHSSHASASEHICHHRTPYLELDVHGPTAVLRIVKVRQWSGIGVRLLGSGTGAAPKLLQSVQSDHPGRYCGGEVLGSEWSQRDVLPCLK